jgi:molecular chaperone DnaJ
MARLYALRPPPELERLRNKKPPNLVYSRHHFLCEVPISFVQAAIGGDLEVPTLSGKAQIQIPAGTQNGTVFRVKGKGVKNVRGYGLGDLHVRVTVEVPSRLNAAQRHKLEEFAALCDENVNPLRKGFFAKAKEFFQ